MNDDFLIETRSGKLVRKVPEEIQPEDRLVFDGPEAFSRLEAAQHDLEQEIAAAGGLEAWQAAQDVRARLA